jgi:hypothetical protein
MDKQSNVFPVCKCRICNRIFVSKIPYKFDVVPKIGFLSQYTKEEAERLGHYCEFDIDDNINKDNIRLFVDVVGILPVNNDKDEREE